MDPCYSCSIVVMLESSIVHATRLMSPCTIINVNGKDLLGAVFSIFDNLRVKGQGHQMTKYGQKYSPIHLLGSSRE